MELGHGTMTRSYRQLKRRKTHKKETTNQRNRHDDEPGLKLSAHSPSGNGNRVGDGVAQKLDFTSDVEGRNGLRLRLREGLEQRGQTMYAYVANFFKENVIEGERRLISGDSLLREMEESSEPFSKRDLTFNAGERIFFCGLWDMILRTMFLEENAVPNHEIEARLTSFCTEFIPETGAEFDLSLFREFALFVEKRGNGIIGIAKCNWYDLPAVLRIIAPTTKKMRTDGWNKKFWMKSVLKALPHSVIMMPWNSYNVGKYSRSCTDIKKVRSTKKSSKCYLVTHIVILFKKISSTINMCNTQYGALKMFELRQWPFSFFGLF